MAGPRPSLIPPAWGGGLRCHLSDELPGGARAAGLSIKVPQDTPGGCGGGGDCTWDSALCIPFLSHARPFGGGAGPFILVKGFRGSLWLSLLVLITFYT